MPSISSRNTLVIPDTFAVHGTAVQFRVHPIAGGVHSCAEAVPNKFTRLRD